MMKKESSKKHNKLYKTNDLSTQSKLSVIQSGYFKDDVMPKLFMPNANRTELVKRGYAVRMHLIKHAVYKLILTQNFDSVIMLGAGFDTLALRFISDYPDRLVKWVEVDLPEVTSRKAATLAESYVMPNLKLRSDASFAADKYFLVPCDMRFISDYKTKLKNILAPEDRRVLVVNEVCLCYLEEQHVYRLIEATFHLLSTYVQLSYVGFEQFDPCASDGFISIMTDHFKSMSHPLKYVPQIAKLIKFFSSLNEKSKVYCARSIYEVINLDIFPLKNVLSKESDILFDEYEEMSLYLSHYAYIHCDLYNTSSVGQHLNASIDAIRIPHPTQGNEISTNKELLHLKNATCKKQQLARYSHFSCYSDKVASNSYGLIFGGVGCCRDNKQHRRQTKVVKFDSKLKMSSVCVKAFDEYPNISLDKQHGQTLFICEDTIFCHGGRKSPSRSCDPWFIGKYDETSNKLFPLIVPKVDDHRMSLSWRWRHRLIKLSNHLIVQIGGLTNNELAEAYLPVMYWNFGNSEPHLSCYDRETLNYSDCCAHCLYDRHSFVADNIDENTYIIHGGLQTFRGSWDKPVESKKSIAIIDIRDTITSNSVRLCSRNLESSSEFVRFGATGHMINTHQLIMLGGISTKTGLCENSLIMFDIRNQLHLKIASGLALHSDSKNLLINHTSHIINNKITTIGGGGNYFTFGSHFNKHHIVLELDCCSKLCVDY